MTHYLEFEDSKSSKFWMIEKRGSSHTVTYGKIGSDGRTSTKEFDSPEQAQKSAAKLLKSKLKKGYVEAATIDADSRTVIDLDEAKARYDLSKYDPLGILRYSTVVVYEGDVTIQGNVDKKTVESLFFGGKRESTDELVIIDGDLTVKGSLEQTATYPCILVLGDLRCEVLTSVDACIHVTGDAFVETAFFGNYNHGNIRIEGTTHVPFVFNGGHGCSMTVSPKTVCINYQNSYDDFFEYDYYASDLKDLFPDDLFEWHSDIDFEFDWWSVRAAMKAGESPFAEGAEPDSMTSDEIRKRAR